MPTDTKNVRLSGALGVSRIVETTQMHNGHARKTKRAWNVPRPSLDNERYAFVSGVILLGNVPAGVVRHERRRHHAYDRAAGDVDGNRVSGVISGEKGCRDQ